jgi:hypothetical protein
MGRDMSQGVDQPTVYVPFYHVAPLEDVAAMREYIDPGENDWGQYGRGFYTFASRDDADRWQRVLQTSISTAPTLVLEYRIPLDLWDWFRRRDVWKEYNWRVPRGWLAEYDVLEGPWESRTPATAAMAGCWQVKFGPHTYPWVARALQDPGERLQ